MLRIEYTRSGALAGGFGTCQTVGETGDRETRLWKCGLLCWSCAARRKQGDRRRRFVKACVALDVG